VPVGRDATVDWGSLDLVIANNQEVPIAIVSDFKPGTLTFKILGQKDEAKKIEIVTSNHKSWDRGMETWTDPNLPVGRRKVIEKGSRGHSINTYRVVYEGGKEVRRESLGHSHYKGTPRIVVVGTKGAVKVNKPTTPPVAPGEPPTGTGLND
jgi:vancomycin resistance protein YoaR